MFCTGAVESSDSILPTTGFFGGWGIGLSLFVDAIAWLSPALVGAVASTVIASEAKQSKAAQKVWIASSLRASQ
jgi:hypothetical protein